MASMAKPKAKTAHSSGANFDQFSSLLDRYAAFVEQAGKTIFRAPETEARALFAGLGEDQGRWIIDRLRNELAAIEELVAHGERLDNTTRLLWRFFQQTGFTPCGDLLDKIGDSDVVEVYAPNQVHIWQSLNFFDWVSMSIEKIYTETWYECTVREPGHERELGLIGNRVFAGEFNSSIEPKVPWHWVHEVGTPKLYKFEFFMRYMSPVFLDGKVVALVTVNQCRSLTR